MIDAEVRARWAKAVADHEDASPPAEVPPDVETVWSALSGELDPVRARSVLTEALASPQGHEELRLFLELEREFDVEPAVPMRGRVRVLVAAGAVLAAAAAVWLVVRAPVQPVPSDPGTIRAPQTASLATTLDGEALPRDGFALTWSPPGQGCVYTVRASTEDARVITEITGLQEPRHRLSADLLREVSSGSRVLWQVDFSCGDERGQSRTFATKVAP